jgi:PAS domain S-box-containing protein
MDSRKQPDFGIESDVLQALVAGTAVEVGEEFFHELVRHVAEALGTKGVWVTEWDADKQRLRALAFWYDGAPFGDYEYAVAGTPCEPVIETEDVVHFPDRLVELFPGDPDLPELGAVSYMGVSLHDTGGAILGHLAVLHDEAMPANPQAEAVFRIFAGRAASELRRLRSERDLREREEKLSLLVGSAMDAIVELDDELHITGMNAAAERTFACESGMVTGGAFDRFLEATAYDRLRRLTAKLHQAPAGERSVWIPAGFSALTADGKAFPAEATLSGFELNGRSFYTLILRNVDERRAAEERIRELTTEAAYLRAELDELGGFDEIVGVSDSLRTVLADVDRVAKSDVSVLITGETGTGKELFARAIHGRSARAEKPLVKVNCAAIAPTLQESEFFGHVKGAFTGATRDRVGRFELADGGTIFLDEVGEMPTDLQAKLLRALQEGEFEPVGGTETRHVDVRVIAATNRDLETMVAKGEFRSDLFYRLNVFPLHVPALRERGDDVVLLAETFLRRLERRSGRSIAPLTPDCKARLVRYDWPGNVRELENVIERGFLTSQDGRRLNLERALPEFEAGAGSAPVEPTPGRILTATELRDFERANFMAALEAADWKVSGAGGAAELLGLNPNTLASRMRALGIERPR